MATPGRWLEQDEDVEIRRPDGSIFNPPVPDPLGARRARIANTLGRDLDRDEAAITMRELGVVDTIKNRLFGTDLPNDPLATVRLAPAATLGIAGGMLGAKTPVAPGPWGLLINPITGSIIGSTLGVTAGALSPEATMEFGEKLGLLPPGTREANGLTNQELITLARGEALLELTLSGGVAGLGQLRRGTARAMTGVGSRGSELADYAAAHGVQLSALVAGNSPFARGFMAVFGRFPLIGQPVKKQAEAANKDLQRLLTELPERTSQVFSSSQVGRDILRNAGTTVKWIGRTHDKVMRSIFSAAKANNVKVIPRHLRTEADTLLGDLLSSQRSAKGGKVGVSRTRQPVIDFINREVIPMYRRVTGQTTAGTVTAKQSLEEMDAFITKIEEEKALIESQFPRIGRIVAPWFNRLKIAAIRDTKENLDGALGPTIGAQIARADLQYSERVASLFMNSPTAQRMFRVSRKGMRGGLDVAPTQTPVDALGNILIDMKAPQVVDEIAAMTSKRTMDRVQAHVLWKTMQTGWDEATGIFDPYKIEKAWLRKGTNERQMITKLLEKTGGLTIKELDKVMDISKQFAETPIPDFSTFIARKAVIGSMRGVKGGLVPQLGTKVIGSILSLIGLRGLASMMADPLAARSFKSVLSETTKRSQKLAAATRLIRLAAEDPISKSIEAVGGRIDEEPGLLGGESFNRRIVSEKMVADLIREAQESAPPPPAPIQTRNNVPNLQPPGIGSRPPVLPSYIPNDPRPQSMSPASPQTMGTMNMLRNMLSPRR